MRTSVRDHRTIHYANLVSTQDEFDDDGNPLLYPIQNYETDPHTFRASLSPTQGEVAQKLFGGQVEYDKIILTERVDLPLSESTRFWIDRDTTESHNYEVVKVSRTYHMVMIAIKSVNVSYGN